MTISPAEHGLELGKNAPGYTRSPGLHMSDVYTSLYATLEPKRYAKDKHTPPPLTKLELGMVFEELLEQGLKARLARAGRPGEFMTPEGIAYSPDLLFFNGETRLGEIKLTWMSCKEAPVSAEQAHAAGRPTLATDHTGFSPKFNKWFTQMKAYCFHLGLLDARLIVFFVNGNYKPPSPVVLAWDVQFTPQELQEEWDALLNHAKAERMLS